MQVLCKSTQSKGEVQCPICGLGFILFWERQSRQERADGLREIHRELIGHHRASAGQSAHPVRGFLVPEREGNIVHLAAPQLGMVPAWDL